MRRSELATRALSAAVLAPIAIAAVWYGGVAFAVFILLIAAIGTDEWIRMTSPGAGPSMRAGLALVVVGLVVAGVYPDAWLPAQVVVGVGVVAAIVAIWREPNWRWPAFVAIVYLGAPSYCLLWLRGRPDDGLALVVFLLVAIWATDIGAYFSGRTIGGPKIAPRISPKKTWAGLLGGMAAAAAIGAAVAAGFGFSPLGGGLTAPWAAGALVGAVLAVIGQIGDFFESWVKRRAGVKDSGRIIPGHGGVLDRVDGALAAALALAAFYAW